MSRNTIRQIDEPLQGQDWWETGMSNVTDIVSAVLDGMMQKVTRTPMYTMVTLHNLDPNGDCGNSESEWSIPAKLLYGKITRTMPNKLQIFSTIFKENSQNVLARKIYMNLQQYQCIPLKWNPQGSKKNLVDPWITWTRPVERQIKKEGKTKENRKARLRNMWNRKILLLPCYSRAWRK